MPAAPAVGIDNPFVGVRPFESHEAPLFHGRTLHTQQLLRFLAAHRFVGVTGTSASGKSSLVRAGLLPALHRGYLPGTTSRWRVVVMRPGVAPLAALAHALREQLGLAAPATKLIERLEQDSAALTEIAHGVLERGRENLLVVVDQFEEVFGDSVPVRDAAYFIATLLRARDEQEVPVYVVLTMRSEFLGECARYPGLAEALSEAQYLIPRLSRAEREEAIRRPLDLFGIEIEDTLVERLLNDAGDDPDQLTALQHALRMLAGVQPPSGPLSLAQYEGDRGFQVGRSLDSHAEAIFASLTESQKLLAQRIFRRLTVTERGRMVRRPTRLAQLYSIAGAETPQAQSDVREVVRSFAARENSLIYSSTGAELSGDTLIDISHESLMRQWERLKDWVKQEAESAAVFRRLVESAELCREGKGGLCHDPDVAYMESKLAADGWNLAWGDQYCPGFTQAIGFLRESRAAIEADAAKERERAERELKAAQDLAETKQRELIVTTRLRNKLMTAVIVLAILTAALYWALQSQSRERSRADQASNLANDLRARAEIDSKRAQAAEAEAKGRTLEVQALQATGKEKERLAKEAAQFRKDRDDLVKQAKAEQGKLQSASDAATQRIADLQSELKREKDQAVLVRRQLDDANEKLKAAPEAPRTGKQPDTELVKLKQENQNLREQLQRLSSPPAPEVATPRAPGIDPKTGVNSGDGLKYVRINPGKFEMGCSEGDKDCDKDEVRHDVEITLAFWIGQTEVTQEAYRKVMKADPSHFKGANRPVENVSWSDASAYCKLVGGRLPTEAEWEYAARAGNPALRYGPIDRIAWYHANSSRETHPVGALQPNAWGLYDMLGNVWEWVGDWYDPRYYDKASKDPQGPRSSPFRSRVVRGGSIIYYQVSVRLSFRSAFAPTYGGDALGFRCAGELP